MVLAVATKSCAPQGRYFTGRPTLSSAVWSSGMPRLRRACVRLACCGEGTSGMGRMALRGVKRRPAPCRAPALRSAITVSATELPSQNK